MIIGTTVNNGHAVQLHEIQGYNTPPYYSWVCLSCLPGRDEGGSYSLEEMLEGARGHMDGGMALGDPL